MSIKDNLIVQYFELLTDVTDVELDEFRQSLSSGTVNPMTLKKRLAREILVQLYSEEIVKEAEDYFIRTVQKKEIPQEISEYQVSYSKLASQQAEEPGIDISRLLLETGLARSRSEASRMIKQGAIEIDGEKITTFIVQIKSPAIIQAGKRHFAKIVNTDTI